VRGNLSQLRSCRIHTRPTRLETSLDCCGNARSCWGPDNKVLVGHTLIGWPNGERKTRYKKTSGEGVAYAHCASSLVLGRDFKRKVNRPWRSRSGKRQGRKFPSKELDLSRVGLVIISLSGGTWRKTFERKNRRVLASGKVQRIERPGAGEESP